MPCASSIDSPYSTNGLRITLPKTSRSIPQLMPDGSSPSGGTDCLSGDMVRAIAFPARPAALRRPSDHQLSRGRATELGRDSTLFLPVESAENHEANTGDTMAGTGARDPGAW